MNLLQTLQPQTVAAPTNAQVIKGALSKSGKKPEVAPKAAKAAVAKPAKATKPKTAQAILKPSALRHPDGTIFFRADRRPGRQYIAMLDGIQKAARPSVAHCRKYLENQGFKGTVVVLEATAKVA